ncbi:MAG: hypothetical protein K2P94_03055 [Rhodospirillaceae bacterium]|nr:hypothetical protein [Rhodospirillaceae bacterium]
MIALLVASAIGVVLIIGLALILPCEGCRLRRERMRAAYLRWRETHPDGKR